jgi:hypothetical protein
VSQLVKDVRSMMEPDTARRLKVKRPESHNRFERIVNRICSGTEIEQTKGLHYNGWTLGCHTFTSIFQIKDRKYKSSPRLDSSRPHNPFQSRELFPVQRCV